MVAEMADGEVAGADVAAWSAPAAVVQAISNNEVKNVFFMGS
jgi:hypothetical protein